jgi:alanine transaminase
MEQRDGGVKCDPESLLFADGASPAIAMVILALLADETCGLMLPTPQYPLYSAEVTVCGGKQVPYYLDEESGWQIKVEDLVKAYEDAVQKGINVKGITIINPGNPTGQILEESTMREIVQFAYDHNLTILADEVYQQNVFTDHKQFVSFKKVVANMPSPYNKTALFSFHSTSKGYSGECGLRGGYVEMHNIAADVQAQLKKYRTIGLAPNTIAQITMDMLLNPPTDEENGREVAELFRKERDEVLASLKRKAKAATRIFNTMKNVSCQEIEGALYAFPKIDLPEKAIQEAQRRNIAPDLFYCMESLNATGVITVQGSGFGQKPGTYHFRTTILITPDEKFESKFEEFKTFNDEFMAKYA